MYIKRHDIVYDKIMALKKKINIENMSFSATKKNKLYVINA